jgi:hypothetical protein
MSDVPDAVIPETPVIKIGTGDDYDDDFKSSPIQTQSVKVFSVLESQTDGQAGIFLVFYKDDWSRDKTSVVRRDPLIRPSMVM